MSNLISVNVGLDVEGDHCLYILRDGGFISNTEIDFLATALEQFLNTQSGLALLPVIPDGHPCDICGTFVKRGSTYYETGCGTHCSDCVDRHINECQMCKDECWGDGKNEDDTPEEQDRAAEEARASAALRGSLGDDWNDRRED